MVKVNRKFTPEDLLSIHQEGEREEQAVTIRKYQIALSLYTRWKRKYLSEGLSRLIDKRRSIDPVLRTLELDNEHLRHIIAKQALKIEVKT